ncbi:hypothetical protein [Luteimonas sp. MC1750]|uniref:hypothetical protein n=1 Tax=Luteimonas sp. MC1750 TaxID=2799326 RepID=UPI0018F0DDF0|nr:hypothetical protein [Luteimonas sp. MC1750]MBJ6983962.1 hypothetical protein [Luteimonas sp. MC1750]QQO06775.1 hypothetical protein JGR68_04950 [Luteimonas sp. MC1750]
MTSIEVVRSVEDFTDRAAHKQARLDTEIADAQAGLVSKVSRSAAARYLGMSLTTLAKLMSAGEGPPFIKNEATSRAANQHIHFPWRDLVAWDEARTQYDSPQAKQELREQAHRNELRRQLAQLEQQAQALRRALSDSGDRHILNFEGLASLTQPHPWVLNGDGLVGHALGVSAEALMAGDIDWLTVEEALACQWSDLEGQGQWLEVLSSTMERVEQTAQAWYRRMALMEQVRGKKENDA